MKKERLLTILALTVCSLLIVSANQVGAHPSADRDNALADTIYVTGTIATDTTWTADNIYIVEGDVTVAEGILLTIEPGVIVKFQENTRLNVEGALDARGTASNQIVFTSYNDDDHGGDTDGDGTATPPAKYDWGWIQFADSSDDDASFLEHCLLIYGGYEDWQHYHGIITLYDASPTIRNCTFQHNYINGIEIPGGTKSASATENSETWHNTDVVYAVTGDLTIAEGMKLVVNPGVTVKFKSNVKLVIEGALDARGAIIDTIAFTSLNDDDHGGDTDDDGTNTPPKPKDWSWIQFADSSDDDASLLEHCLFLYGGYEDWDHYHGVVRLAGASPTIANCTFSHNSDYAITVDTGSFPTVYGNTMTDNGTNGIGLYVGTISVDNAQWNCTDAVYVLDGDITIGTGTTLTITPGVIIKGRENTRLSVEGALDARGTTGSPIVFTSYNDDDHGGDTDGDGSATPPAKYDWGWIQFADSSDDDASFLEHCLLIYGGYEDWQHYHGIITLYDASPTIRNCTFQHNCINGIEIPGGTKSASATENSETWHNTDVVYAVTGDLTIAEGMKLVVNPGVTVKFKSNVKLVIEGALDARGTIIDTIAFTSLNDDDHGGDTDDDGSNTPPKPKDWSWIQFADSSDDDANFLEHCLFLYGGYEDWDHYHGVVRLAGASPTIRYDTIAHNSKGLETESGSSPLLRDNSFFANSDYAAYNADTSTILDAEYNWWGHPSGPYHPTLNPDGQGDNVSDNVDFDPWLTTPPAPPATYSISGHVTDASDNGIPDVIVSPGAGDSATTDDSGEYAITDLSAGTYILTPGKSGYTFSPAMRTVTVPPDATGQDFTGVSESTPELVYIGPRYLPADDVMENEIDGRITMGDHVHLRLPFRNVSPRTLSNVTVEVLGWQPSGSIPPGISIYDGTYWNDHQTVALTPWHIGPGEIGIADFWIYVANPTPVERLTLSSETELTVRTEAGQWKIRITLPSISFAINGNEALTARSCLHNPDEFPIQKYAQYAAGACRTDGTEYGCMPYVPPTNNHDPDTSDQAVFNVVYRVRSEFGPDENSTEGRVPDTTLITRRNQKIGVCLHYADLTTGLLRSLNLPTRYMRGWFYDPDWLREDDEGPFEGHAWTEVYLPVYGGWRRADTAWKQVGNEGSYEEEGYTVLRVWADRYPLSSACKLMFAPCLCEPSCYPPTSSDRCMWCKFYHVWTSTPWDRSCVENVTSEYHNVAASTVCAGSAEENDIVVQPQASVFATQTVPFTLTSGVTNNTSTPLNTITATVSVNEFVDSTVPLYEVNPPYQLATNLDPSETVTVTWVVTPLIAGNGIPLRVAATSGDLIGVNEQPLVVNEPGTLPDLSLGAICGLGTMDPGQSVDLTAYVLDETLQPLTDTLTTITATIYATPTLGYRAAVPLTLDTDGFFRKSLNLPTDVPLGTYLVDFVATRLGYDSAQATLAFFVTPALITTLRVTPSALQQSEPLTLTAQVYERDAIVTEASVWADVGTPGGKVAVPLMLGGEVYTTTFRPADLAPNLGGSIRGGQWQITVTADYLGSTSAATGTITVFCQLYLPLILRDS